MNWLDPQDVERWLAESFSIISRLTTLSDEKRAELRRDEIYEGLEQFVRALAAEEHGAPYRGVWERWERNRAVARLLVAAMDGGGE